MIEIDWQIATVEVQQIASRDVLLTIRCQLCGSNIGTVHDTALGPVLRTVVFIDYFGAGADHRVVSSDGTVRKAPRPAEPPFVRHYLLTNEPGAGALAVQIEPTWSEIVVEAATAEVHCRKHGDREIHVSAMLSRVAAPGRRPYLTA